MFMPVNIDPKLDRQYAETWVFVMFSRCVRQGNISGVQVIDIKTSGKGDTII